MHIYESNLVETFSLNICMCFKFNHFIFSFFSLETVLILFTRYA